jgi:hypothetical protein
MKMVHRGFGSVRILGLIIAAIATFAISVSAYAAGTDEDVPATSIVPSGGESAPAAAASPAAASTLRPAGVVTPTATTTKSKSATRHKSTTASSRATAVEPAQARLQLIDDAIVYSSPSKSSKHIKRVTKGKYVVVTGSTHYYLQVSLKDGQTGYLDPSAVSLVSPSDKVFVLTHDAAVLDKPNRWGKKIAAVHKGRSVHATGIALNYMQIKMKSGLTGFIPISALE